MKTVAIIQARMGSTRLPGKVLRKLGGSTVLGHVVRRVLRAAMLHEVIVATTELSADDSIAHEAQRLGVKVFRGSENDVLSRYAMAARSASADVIVRITSDCPLIDPEIVDLMLKGFIDHATGSAGIDYMSNTVQRTFPRGLDAEVIRSGALQRAQDEATEAFEREHVTPYLYGHPELFKIRHFVQLENRSRHRWTLDTPDDWRFFEELFKALGDRHTDVSATDVLKLLDARPDLTVLNAHVEQKAMRE